MYQLTPQGQSLIADLAQRYGVSTDAVMTLLQALLAGNGGMAQFNHPEFGGSGQWMQGGMIMVGDMFNQGLKARWMDCVRNWPACWPGRHCRRRPPPFNRSSRAVRPTPVNPSQGGSGYTTATGGSAPGVTVSLFVPGQGGSGNWWPAELGAPAATGAQNQMRYAYFPNTRRLAVEINGQITVYDTLIIRSAVSRNSRVGTPRSLSPVNTGWWR